MRTYDPTKPIAFIHLPRTGGNSLLWVFREHWFIDKVFMHSGSWPAACKVDGAIVCDHWSRRRGNAAEVHAGGDAQFVTFLRNPMVRFPSIYAHMRDAKAFDSLQDGSKVNVSELTMRQYADVFGWMLRDNFIDMMPAGEYPEFFDNFLFVGLTERYQESLDRLAEILGKPKVDAPYVNVSKGYEMSCETVKLFGDLAATEMRIYEEVKATWEAKWGSAK